MLGALLATALASLGLLPRLAFARSAEGGGAGALRSLVSSYPLPSLALSFAAGGAAGAALAPVVRWYPTAMDLPSRLFRKQRRLRVRVVKVSDGDSLRALHLPPFAFLRSLGAPEGKKSGKRGNGKGMKLSERTMQVRLAAVDCPETSKFGASGQKFGKEAKEFAINEIDGKVVTLKLLSRDQYGRAVCTLSYGWGWQRRDLSEELLKNGLAVVYRQAGAQYDGPVERWDQMEETAQQNRMGLWKEGGVDPAAYKRALREKGA
ncbi:MAG: hypothetical protein SGPRY_013064 [Prymnesium sp.]